MLLPALKRVRELRGFTQPVLAEASGVSLRTIVNAEHAKQARPSTARKMAEALDVTVAVLAGVEPFPAARLALAPEIPPLQLEAMYVEEDEVARRRALEAASKPEIEAYAATIDRVVGDVLGGIPVYERRAEDVSRPERQREVARAARDALLRHISHLLLLRDEATGQDHAPPPQEEVAELVADAQVA